jgi:outer membrane protein TolC
VWTAYQDYQTAMSSHKISLTVLESAKENQKVAFAMYKVGKGSILNLLTAESQLANSRKESIVSFYSVLTQKAKLYRAIGRYN